MNHTFPTKTTLHIVNLNDGTAQGVLVSPTETFGKAIARLGISEDSIKGVEVMNAPMWYEPDFSVASR